MGINDSTGNWLHFTNVSGLPTEALRVHRLKIDLFNREFQPQIIHKSSIDLYRTSYDAKKYFQLTNMTSSSVPSNNSARNSSNRYTREQVFQRALCRIYLVDYVCLRYALPPICADLFEEIDHFTNTVWPKIHRIINRQIKKVLLGGRIFSNTTIGGGEIQSSSGSSKSASIWHRQHTGGGRFSKPHINSNSVHGRYKSIGGHDITSTKEKEEMVGITITKTVKPPPVQIIPLQSPPPNKQSPSSMRMKIHKRGLPKPQPPPPPYKTIGK